eukprot:TRINITY_DN6874_c1_g1_i1.p1 TRINITY_DN6874_c1_g1~~TRINITY_DN6874_c1_g1_i1.p1  ORF type:complete len:204 (+),score=63.28 TRINITY_DN6874_c1_g1_i1:92-613(+)
MAELPLPEGGTGGLTIRRDIRAMPEADQQRFVAIVNEMMKREDVFTSWARIGSIHGRFCVHGQETFPGWHRAYLMELEQAIQEVDRDLGNDGTMCIPYWDWTREINGEFTPDIIFNEITKLPDHIGVVINRTRPRLVKNRLRGIDDDVFDCLDSEEHWRHASTRWAGWDGPSN